MPYRVLEILKLSADYLGKKEIDNARLNAELLLGHLLKLNRVQLYLNFERPLTPDELEQYRQLLRRRAAHEPIQYILGETEFFSLKFKLNQYTLIPRPETELLVERVIELCQDRYGADKTISIFDIGTGCGNIAIALAKHLPNSRLIAVDIQPEAIKIAGQNALAHEVSDRIRFVQLDIFSDAWPVTELFDVIVSNPPYVSRHEFDQLPKEVKDFEPYIALDGGTDGLDFYRRIAQIALSLLSPVGFIAIEIGALQFEAVRELFDSTHIFRSVELVRDLNGLPRIVMAKK
ncbi:MAG: peptide chain release factor N(5)-glutamine methyltransferase [candidate division KSB1 bacterium]|nr:peptide chain release factor N(5)-glutamine methyltransferase [candidate division KSB1 bacterium]MDZ7334481.1 peptide chain release factor N(5)-glutamine methyltransferase [candidate division KSB1 bacterium]MDZ7356008.1 peptide chain release factor N(5)-glutamine methyltransferase [candidate division KSB1 bacterium]MDZ7400658.1 peptide chain release factor N(5)-glutamine methyltransferase [candidate division KSB1 bacterium]